MRSMKIYTFHAWTREEFEYHYDKSLTQMAMHQRIPEVTYDRGRDMFRVRSHINVPREEERETE